MDNRKKKGPEEEVKTGNSQIDSIQPSDKIIQAPKAGKLVLESKPKAVKVQFNSSDE